MTVCAEGVHFSASLFVYVGSVPTIVVDLYVNTGENAVEIQQIVQAVHDVVQQKLVVERNIKTPTQ